MKYDASTGGHGPGYLRDAFPEWLEESLGTVSLDLAEADCGGRPRSLR
jgi:hypothetical protein